jgi:hypothetical protein
VICLIFTLPATTLRGSELWPSLGEFRCWTREHRGLTIRHSMSMRGSLLDFLLERVISSCNNYLFGLRDRAVLLLLVRLGLRASEVAQLKVMGSNGAMGTGSRCLRSRWR